MRLIDADELIPSLKMGEVNADTAYGDGRNGGIYFAIWRIGQMPTIDAVPVRHGEWYGEADGYADGELVYDMWYCSFCGKRFEEWDEKPNWNFCPNCGADMRGEGNEN